MRFIKNRTPYLGKLCLKFELYPDYEGHFNGARSFLNKVHLNLGFTKLVSRITPFYTHSQETGFVDVVDGDKVALIEQYTGGLIKDVKYGEGTDAEFTMHNAFVHPDGRLIGTIRDAWWYYNNRMFITDIHPCGVAIVVKKGRNTELFYDDDIEGFYGYNHMGGCLFKIGDKLFDENFTGNLSEAQLAELPYTQYGEKTITTWDEAEQAAINLSKHLS